MPTFGDRLIGACLIALAGACTQTDAPAAELGEDSSGDGDGDEQPATYTYWRDAKPILDAKCTSCHVDGDIAPFALADYADVAAVAAILPFSIETGTMPPWPPGDGCNEYRHDRSLTDAERELLLTWLAEGAPEGDPEDEPPSASDPGPEFEADVSLAMLEPYTPTGSPDDYRCFVIPWDGPEPYVTGFRVVPGERSIVHHVIAFAIEPDQAAIVEDLDAAEDGPGYTCFGGAGVASARWIGSWAPGGRASVFPEGTGVRLDPGSRVVLQVHYNTSVAQPLSDQSAIELSLADAVARPLVSQPVTNPGWVAGFEPMTIPAGEPEVTHAAQIDLGAPLWAAQLAELGPGEDITLHVAGLHMHQLGVRGKLTIERAGGEQDCVLEIPIWDFGWQGGYELVEPIVIHPGDRVGVECAWDNSAGNQPIVDGERLEPIDVQWGEGTRDEMCLAVLALSRP